MGGTFNRLKETEENNKWKEVAGMMVENEKLINRTRKFANAKYIIVVTQEQAEYKEPNWEGMIKKLKRRIERNDEVLDLA